MSDLSDIVTYFSRHFSAEHDLTLTRVIRMVYLADWRSWLVRERPLTTLSWEVGQYGPYNPELKKIIINEFEVEGVTNQYGNPKQVVRTRGQPEPDLELETREILDFVLQATAIPWDAQTELVYSTYPMLVSDKGTTLDLEALANEYKEKQQKFIAPG